MSTPINDKRNGLSAVERLKVTEKYLAELEGVLTSMDEIAALRAKGNKKKSDEVGGYKRSSVEKMIVELKKQKNAILNEIEANERSIAARTAAVKRSRFNFAASSHPGSGRSIPTLLSSCKVR